MKENSQDNIEKENKPNYTSKAVNKDNEDAINNNKNI